MAKQISKIHPELRQIAQFTPPVTFTRRNLRLVRLLIAWLPALRTPEGVKVENFTIPGGDQQKKIRLRIYRPTTAGAPAPALIWLHGGGYVIGKPEMDDRRCAEYVRQTGVTVVSVDYRLAPEHPFPAALEDAHAALVWAVSNAQTLGVDPARTAVGGASAGGGLAAALTQLAHDRGAFKPVFQLLVYPMLDDRTALRADIEDGNNITWNQKSNRFGWESYLGGKFGAEDVPAYSVPARREDLSGLPPAWVGVGSLDVFHDEAAAYAQRLQACGTVCDLHVVEGAFHGFDVVAPQASITQNFLKSQCAALKKYLL